MSGALYRPVGVDVGLVDARALRLDLVFMLPIALAASVGGIVNLFARPLPPDPADPANDDVRSGPDSET